MAGLGENHTLVSECWKSWDREGGGWWVGDHRTLVFVCLKNWDRTEEGKGGGSYFCFRVLEKLETRREEVGGGGWGGIIV